MRMGERTMKEAQLLEREHQVLSANLQLAIEEHISKKNLVTFIGTAPIPRCSIVTKSDGATSWVFLDASEDPHFASGLFAIPRRERRRLDKIDKNVPGIERVYIGHELHPRTEDLVASNGLVDLEAVAIAIGDPTTDPRVEAIAMRVRQGFDLLGVATVAFGVVLTAIALAPALVAVGGPLALVSGLDPVVIGAIPKSGNSNPGELADFYLLAQWC